MKHTERQRPVFNFRSLYRLVVAIVIVAVQLPAHAQQSVDVRGTVQTAQGSVAGLVVELISQDGRTREVAIDQAGRFSVTALPAGPYRIRLIVPGFSTSDLGDVIIGVGKTSKSVQGVTVDFSGVASTTPPPPPPPIPPAPPLPPTPVFPPVYNAVFDGAVESRPLRLRVAVPVTVRFFIGPRDDRNSLPGPSWTVNPAILNTSGMLDLTVNMYCDVCESTFQKDAIVYDGTRRRSTEARFTVAPSSDRITAGIGRIVFNVASRGHEYDNVTVEFTVGTDVVPPPEVPEREWEPPPPEGPDADLEISAEAVGDRIAFRFEPFNPLLKTAWGQKYLEAGRFKKFMSGPNAVTEAAGIVSDVYTNLVAVAAPFDSELRKALSQSASGVPRITDLDRVPEKQAKELLEHMIRRSRTLYGKAFLSDDSLAEMFTLIESANIGRRLRIVIRQAGLAMPWQLLHPPGPLEPMSVWGFKYELSVIPAGRRAGRLPARSVGPAKTLFGVYGDRTADEDVYELGRRSKTTFDTDSKSMAEIAASKKTLVEFFTNRPQDVGLFVTYTHAHSGRSTSLSATPAQIALGPRIEFKPDEFVSAKDLDDIVSGIFNSVQYRTQFFLKQRPLVILNACETGVATVSNATAEGFPEVFLWLGARGVVATEGPVPVYFGFFFGRDLLAAVRAGKTFPEAITDVRLAMWKQNNPLGLLYAYFGTPFGRGL